MNGSIDPRAIPSPAESDAIVRLICDGACQPFRGTWTLDEAAELLRAAEYDVSPRTLVRFQERGYMSRVPDGIWLPIHLHCAMACCELRRLWLPSPSRHDVKKSNARLQVEAARAAGESTFADINEYSLEDLLLHLTNTDHRQLREVTYEAILAKLDALGCIEE